jgi:glycosyltransferase involved in cell wall biosynthesis
MNNKSSVKPLKKVCLITDFYWPSIGGVEQWVRTIASNLSAYYDVTIVTLALNSGISPFGLNFIFRKKIKNYKDEAGNQVIVLNPFGITRLFLLPLIAWKLPFVKKLFPQKLFDNLYIFYKAAFYGKISSLIVDFNIVHCFSTGYAAICTTDACMRLSVPLIHSPPVHFSKWGDTRLLLESYSKARMILCLSESFKSNFRKNLPNSTVPVYTVPVPIPFPENLKNPEIHIPTPFILFLGKREKNKGLQLLLSAFEKISRPISLVIAGPGKKNPSGNPWIIDMGIVDEAEKNWLVAHCGILCVPSSDESFGIVYAEAMAHGKPIAALDISPVNEIVINNVTGLLTPPGNIDMLRDSLDTMLNNPEKAGKMGENGYKRYCEFFEEKTVMKKIMLHYDSIIKK